MNGGNSSPVVAGSVDAISVKLKPFSVPVFLAGIGGGISLLLALFEPMISGELGFLGRLLFFALHIGPAFAIAWPLTGWLFSLRLTRGVWPWITVAAAGFLSGLIVAPWSVVLEYLFNVVETDGAIFEAPFTVWTEVAQDLLAVPPKTTAVWLAVNSAIAWRMQLTASGRESTPDREPPLAPAADTSSLFARVPARLGRDVMFLEAQEHYLRVVLFGGEQLLLHGLANAIMEIDADGTKGMLVHRSYWVNWAHVARVAVDSTGGYAELVNGVRIPVSRRRAAAVRAAFHNLPINSPIKSDAESARLNQPTAEGGAPRR
jgi:hypothetical protein